MKFDGETRNFAVENDREYLGLESPFRFFSKWDPPISIFIEMGPPISIFIEMGSPCHFDFFRNGTPLHTFGPICAHLGQFG